MLTTGTVQLSLADVDALRHAVHKAEEDIKKKELEIAELKAKQREVLITESELSRSNELDINIYALSSRIREIQGRNRHRPEYGMGTSYGNAEAEFIRAINDYVKPVYSNPTVKNVYYKNLDDIQAELRVKLEEEFEERLRDMNSKVNACDSKIREIRDEERKRASDISTMMQKTIDGKDKQIEDLQKKIIELETGVREKKEAERLKEENDFLYYAYSYTVDKLVKFTSQSWLKKLFGGLSEEITIEKIRKAFEKSRAQKGE